MGSGGTANWGSAGLKGATGDFEWSPADPGQKTRANACYESHRAVSQPRGAQWTLDEDWGVVFRDDLQGSMGAGGAYRVRER